MPDTVSSREILIAKLGKIAAELRVSALTAISNVQSGHPGGTLSTAEIMATLFFHKMRLNPQDPNWEGRDRFILSKGHAAPMLYAALAKRGFFPESELSALRSLGSRLQGHPDRNKTPGVDMSSGSLGQGLSVGLGIALANRLLPDKVMTFVLMGDGELQEGQCWEAIMAAGHFKVERLIAIVDRNNVQLDGFVHDIMNVGPLDCKWQSFGWQAIEADGHDIAQLVSALDKATSMALDGPVVLFANTIKGKGVSYMENNHAWHGTPPNAEQTKVALDELRRRIP
jgi:transketolase